MKLSATPVTAALAGIFSAIFWPLLWSRFGNPASTGTFELVIGTILVIALPAHAFGQNRGRHLAAEVKRSPRF